MQHTVLKYLSLSLLLCSSVVASSAAAQTYTSRSNPDSARFSVRFRQSKWNIDRRLGDNALMLDSIDRLFTTVLNDSIYRLRSVSFTGGASPEGSIKINRFLSEKRALALFNRLNRYGNLDDGDKTFIFLGRDWESVLRLAKIDAGIPYREETLALLQEIADKKRQTGTEPARSLYRLKRLRGGKPYLYLYCNIFPAVRTSRLVIEYDRILLKPLVSPDLLVTADIDSVIAAETYRDIAIDTTSFGDNICRPFYMDVRTNLLFDALALPNIGLEFYVGKNFSIGGNWVYAWWSKNATHHFWRAYGGELFGRWWFGSKAHRKPLTGHHLGVYGQIYTYDFEMGGKGQMGGKPGGTLWDKAQWGAGIEYGYSIPVGRRINIDFTLGIGYTTGHYIIYKPIDGHYVWQATNHRRWFGPTKAEISLVWLLGCDNYNRSKAKKGGKR